MWNELTTTQRDGYMLAAQYMEQIGGSFASYIARAFFAADAHNKTRLLGAFPELFERYAQLAAERSE